MDHLFGSSEGSVNDPDVFIGKLKVIEKYRKEIDKINLEADKIGIEIDHNVARMIDFIIEFESWGEEEQINYLRENFPKTDKEKRYFEEAVEDLGVRGALDLFVDTLVLKVLELEERRLQQSFELAKTKKRISDIGDEVKAIMFERN